MTAVYPVLATVAAYLLGSLSFAVIVTRVMGLSDPRTYGSKKAKPAEGEESAKAKPKAKAKAKH